MDVPRSDFTITNFSTFHNERGAHLDFTISATTKFLLITLVVLLSWTATWAFIYWWKKSAYTRERFAFFGAAALVSLTSLLFAQITSGTSILPLLINLIPPIAAQLGLKEILGLPDVLVDPQPISPAGSAICCLVIFLLGHWFFKVFSIWDGQKSVAQHEQEKISLKPSILRDVTLLLSTDKEKRKRLAPYTTRLQHENSLLSGPADTLAWHEQVRQLWLLRHKDHRLEEDYDAVHRCWLGAEKSTETLLCLACWPSTPTEDEVAALRLHVASVCSAKGFKTKPRIIGACKYREVATLVRGTTPDIIITTQEELLEKLVDFTDYFNDIDSRITTATLPDSSLTLSETYARSRCKGFGGNPGTEVDVENALLSWADEPGTRQLALLAEYGQGKSTVSLMFSHRLIARLRQDQPARIPILIELRGKSPRSLTPEELLATWAFRYGIQVQSLLQLLLAGQLILIFEGFDEIDLTGDSDARIGHFRTLWRFAIDNSKVLITGRPNFFLDDSERKRALGIENPTPFRPYCEALFLSPFSIDEIVDSLRQVDAQTRAEVVELARNNERFREIVSRPSLLHIVSTLWRRERLSEHAGQITSALVMQLFIRHSYRRQGAKEQERNFMALNSAEREYFMTGIAAYMAAKALPNQISLHQLNAVIDLLVEAIPDEVSAAVGSIASETRSPLRHSSRFDWQARRQEAFEHIRSDVRACGILVSDLSKDGTFKFAHKSFMEYLQGELIYRSTSDNSQTRQAAESILNSLDLSISHFAESTEAMQFLAELISAGADLRDPSTSTVTAKALFDIFVIGEFGQRRIGTLGLRCSVFFHVKVANLISKVPRFRKSATHCLRISRALLASLIITSTQLFLMQTPFATWDKRLVSDNLEKVVMSAIFMVLIMVGFLTMTNSLSQAMFRLRLWYKVCREIGLASDSLVRFTGYSLAIAFENEQHRIGHEGTPAAA